MMEMKKTGMDPHSERINRKEHMRNNMSRTQVYGKQDSYCDDEVIIEDQMHIDPNDSLFRQKELQLKQRKSAIAD